MTAFPDDALAEIRRTLERWQATHPEASMLEIEEAVEEQLHHLRASLLAERVDATVVHEHPLCRECGARMEPRTQQQRRLALGGEEAVELERSYSVCPSCGAGLFPPG